MEKKINPTIEVFEISQFIRSSQVFTKSAQQPCDFSPAPAAAAAAPYPPQASAPRGPHQVSADLG
jgi:hypothetical protein